MTSQFSHQSRYSFRGDINTGALYIIAIILIIIAVSYIATGPTPTHSAVPNGTEVVIGKAKKENNKAQLQLYTFAAATITPPMSSLCQKGGANKNPELIIATYPPNGTGITKDDQIKAWLNDSTPFKVAPGEIITRGSGAVKTPGDRTAKAPDNYLIEPALYIFPNTADAGGRPYFPTFLKGSYDNGDIRVSYNSDPVPNSATFKDKGRSLELVWNVKDLNLGTGSYQLQFVAHDGQGNLAVKCVSMRIYDTQDERYAIPDQ